MGLLDGKLLTSDVSFALKTKQAPVVITFPLFIPAV